MQTRGYKKKKKEIWCAVNVHLKSNFKFLNFTDQWIFFKFKRLMQNTDMSCYLQPLGYFCKWSTQFVWFLFYFNSLFFQQRQTEREMQWRIPNNRERWCWDFYKNTNGDRSRRSDPGSSGGEFYRTKWNLLRTNFNKDGDQYQWVKKLILFWNSIANWITEILGTQPSMDSPKINWLLVIYTCSVQILYIHSI